MKNRIQNDKLEKLKSEFADIIKDLNALENGRAISGRMKKLWKQVKEYSIDSFPDNSPAEGEIAVLRERSKRVERAFSDTRESLSELLSAQKLAAAIRATHDIPSLCRIFVDTISQVVPIEEVGIFRIEDSQYERLYPDSVSEKFQRQLTMNWEEGLVDWVINEERPILFDDPDRPAGEAARGYLLIPLIISGEPFGFTQALVTRPPKDFNPTDLEIVFFHASQTALALENASLVESLTETKDFLEGILENAHDIIIVYSHEGKIIFVNRAVEAYGYRREDLQDQPIRKILEENQDVSDLFHSSEQAKHINLNIRNRESQIVNAIATISPLDDESGKSMGFLAIIKDISEQKKLETQLLRSERMAAIAETAITINHEINNPLAIVMGHLYLVKNRAQELGQPDMLEKLEVMEKNCRRIRKIAHRLQNLKDAGSTQYLEDIKMLDINEGPNSIEII